MKRTCYNGPGCPCKNTTQCRMLLLHAQNKKALEKALEAYNTYRPVGTPRLKVTAEVRT